MPTDPDLERTRRYAVAEVRRILGMTEPTPDRLFALARKVIGQDRANLCLDLAKQAPLTRRWVPAAAMASLVAGTQELGPEWWTRMHQELTADRQWADKGLPDKLLTAGHGEDPDNEDGGSCLALLGEWISDDAADNAWGRPVDWVDMAQPRTNGVVLPPEARAGDRLTAIYAPGGRIWVDVVEHEGGSGAGRSRLGTRLAERKLHDVALIRSAWSMSTSGAPTRLPGEMPGRQSDPFSDKIDAVDSRHLFEWAVAHGANAREIAGPWRTKDALWSARLKMGLLYGRPGVWIAFDDAVVALVDGNDGALGDALNSLEG